MKSKIFKNFLIALPLLLSVVSCKKNDVQLSATAEDPSNTANKPRADIPGLYIRYVTDDGIKTPKFITTNIISNVTNFNFNTPLTQPNFHIYHKSTDELWYLGPNNDNIKLMKYNVFTKAITQIDILPAIDQKVRKLIGADDIKKKMYYLEGDAKQLGFARIVSCNFDGTAKSTVIETGNDIVAAVVAANNKIYYASRATNTLMEKTIGVNASKTIIQGFNLAGAKFFSSLVVKQSFNNIFWGIIRTQREIDKNQLNLFAVDAVNNKIIWLRDATALIPFTNQDPLKSPDALFKIRPNLVSANLDGTGMVNLDENITSILGKFDAQSLSLPIIGGMEMNPITKKVYVGLEYSYFSSNKVIKDYKGNVTNMPGVNSMLSRYTTVEVDYNGKNPKNLLVEGVTQLAYPKAYNTLPVIGVDNGGLYWSNHATRAKSIALNNFILGNLELNNN